MTRGLVGGLPGRTMGVERGHALQGRSRSAAGGGPGGRDRIAGPSVVRIAVFEDSQDLLRALGRVAGHRPQFVQGQREITRSDRHACHSHAPSAGESAPSGARAAFNPRNDFRADFVIRVCPSCHTGNSSNSGRDFRTAVNGEKESNGSSR
jgi:hypothetical protein